MNGRRSIGLAVLFLLQSSCAPSRFFYHPNNYLYADPESMGLSIDMIEYPTLNGNNLFGMLMRATGDPKGTIVHFHGNYGNVSNHFPVTAFLVEKGFDVFIFDYQGYGGSEGKPSQKNTIEDGVATLRYVKGNNRASSGKIGVFGHSIGGAIAVVALAKEPVADAVLLQSVFTSYRSEARHALGQSIVGWLLYPIYPMFLSKRNDPIRFIDKLPAVPLLFIHGERDGIIPIRMSRTLHERAKEPREFLMIPFAGHNNVRAVGGEGYEKAVAEFFRKAFGNDDNRYQ